LDRLTDIKAAPLVKSKETLYSGNSTWTRLARNTLWLTNS